MIIKYRTGGWNLSSELIKPILVDRETENSVFIGSTRNAKRSSFHNYFDTWGEAKAFLLKNAENEAVIARKRLEYANGKVGNIKGLKKPE